MNGLLKVMAHRAIGVIGMVCVLLLATPVAAAETPAEQISSFRARHGEGESPTLSASSTLVRLASSWSAERIRRSMASIMNCGVLRRESAFMQHILPEKESFAINCGTKCRAGLDRFHARTEAAHVGEAKVGPGANRSG